jgi:threonine dehydratase
MDGAAIVDNLLSPPVLAFVVSLAAALLRREMFGAGAKVGLILCGSNVALDDLAAWRTRFGV